MMTPKQIEALPAGTYPISTHPGLRLEVRGRVKTWTLRRRNGEGKLKQQVVGRWPEMSLAKAAAACELLRAQPVIVGAKPKAVVTVRVVLRSYIVGHLKVARGEWQACEAMLWRHVGDLIDRDAVGVGRADAHALIQGLAGRGSVQRKMRMEMAAAWEWSMAAGALPEGLNPWQKVRVPSPVSRSRVLSDAEVTCLFQWMRETRLGDTTKDAMLLALATGMRSGEVVAMQWAGVDLERGIYHMPTSKNGLGRVVYLNDFAVEVLRRRGRGQETRALMQPWVFPTRDGRRSVQQHILVNAFYRVRESIGLQHFNLHDLRRTCRTGLAMLGCPHEVGEAILGHAVGGVAGVYQLYRYGAEQKKWLDRWGEHLKGLMA